MTFTMMAGGFSRGAFTVSGFRFRGLVVFRGLGFRGVEAWGLGILDHNSKDQVLWSVAPSM